MKVRRVLGFIVGLLLVVTLVGCNSKGKVFDEEKGYITVGLEADYAPFNWRQTTANDYNYPLHGRNDYVAGYDVEIAKYIANELNLELRIQMVSWKGLIPSLTSNQIDLIIAGMSPTEKRKRSISFTDAYYVSTHVVVIDKDGPLAEVDTLEGLKDFRGIGQMGTLYADIVKSVAENYGAKELPQLETVPQIINAITSNAADFTIVEEPVANGLVGRNSNLAIILKSDDNIFNVLPEDREVSIGLRQVDNVLIGRVNDALAKITDAMRNDWMEEAVGRAA